MVSLSDFGEVWRRYEGTGTLVVNGDEYEYDFEAGQLHDNSLYLICHSKYRNWHLGLPEASNINFVGKMQNGMVLRCEGRPIQKSHHSVLKDVYEEEEYRETMVLEYSGEHSFFQVILSTSEKISSWRFHIVNLKFLGNEMTISENNASLNTIVLKLRGFEVKIKKNYDYETSVDGLDKGILQIHVTSTMYVENVFNSEQEAVEFVAQVMKLLTVARGTVVNFISWEALGDGDLLYCKHQTWITAAYQNNSLDLIDKMDLRHFMEQCFDNYVELSHRFSLSAVVSMWVSARSVQFLENRMLILLSLTDSLVNKFSTYHSIQFLLSETDFEKIKALKSELMKDMKPKLKELGLDPELASIFINQINNRRSFRQKIKSLVKAYRVPVSSKEISDFVDARNLMIHETSFVSDDPFKESLKVIHFVDLIILSLLKYEGTYLNVSKLGGLSNRDEFKLASPPNP